MPEFWMLEPQQCALLYALSDLTPDSHDFIHLLRLHDADENLEGVCILARFLTAPRVVQVLILVLFVSGLLTFASPVYGWIQKWIGADAQAAPAFAVLFWSLLLIMVIAPLVAIWRQVEALAMICAEAVTKSRPAWTPLRPVFEKLLRAAVLTAITIWFATFVPYGALSARGLIVLATGGVIIAVIFWRRLIRLAEAAHFIHVCKAERRVVCLRRNGLAIEVGPMVFVEGVRFAAIQLIEIRPTTTRWPKPCRAELSFATGMRWKNTIG